ncbi:MAG TPA: hypothetical protein VFQ77_21730 [Pseudonocardiaceae bacterium]|jgi:tetratricopeptide (TPR) repeat protein|nr:hypothetical protein [Pseudonocardiaceae bacterium]
MTIRDEALRTVQVLAGSAPAGQAPSADPRVLQGEPGQPAVDLVAAVAEPLASRSRIDCLLGQLAARARERRGDAAPAARLAVATVLAVDGPEAAGELLAPWRAARASAGPAGAGCPGCAAELEVRVLVELGRYGEATEVLEALSGEALSGEALSGEALSGDALPSPGVCCPESGLALLGAALPALLGTGHERRALAWHVAGLRGVARHRIRLHLLADHLDFLRLTGNGSAGVGLICSHAALLRSGCTAAQRLRWLTAAAHVTDEQVAAGHGEDLVTVAWPQRSTEPMTLAEFRTALYARATPLAGAFDARNGHPRHQVALAGPHRHDRARCTLALDLRAAAPRRPGRRPVALPDVLACPDPCADAEEALLAGTLIDPVGVWQELVLRAGDRGIAEGAAARAVLARVLCLAGDRDRGLAEAATAEAMSAALGDRVAAAAARATAAACWAQTDPARGLLLVTQVIDELAVLAPSGARDAALCRARSTGVAALLALDRLDEAERWVAEIDPVHPGQQVRVASQRALVLRRRSRLPEALGVLRAGAQLADEHGLVALGVALRVDLAEALELAGDTDGVVGVLTRVLLDLPRVPEPDPLDVPRIRLDLARMLTESGRLVPARAELERVRRELRAAPDTVSELATLELATVDYLLGIVLRELSQPTAALIHFEAAAAAFGQVERPEGVALAERDRGAVLFLLNRGLEAVDAFEAAAWASAAAGDEWHALTCGIDAAQARGHAGVADPTDELHRLRAALPAVAGSDPVRDVAELAFQLARVDHALARCALAGGQVGAAAELAEQALAGYRTAGADRAVVALSVDAGGWWWQAGDPGSAVRYLRGALRSARALGDAPLIARCQAALHRVGDREADLAG